MVDFERSDLAVPTKSSKWVVYVIAVGRSMTCIEQGSVQYHTKYESLERHTENRTSSKTNKYDQVQINLIDCKPLSI